MKLEELINRCDETLTDNDHRIVSCILSDPKASRTCTAAQLAERCLVSRATLLRFCRKLQLRSFAELKYVLQTSSPSCEGHEVLELDYACQAYHQMIDEMKNFSYDAVCFALYQADTIYIYGTGNAQKAEAEEFKRMFLFAGKSVIDLFDLGEVAFMRPKMTPRDVCIVISLSGETLAGIEILKAIADTGIGTLSVTRWNNNTIARMCQNNLYVGTKMLLGYRDFPYELTAAFYVMLDFLLVRYLEFAGSVDDERA